MKVLFAQFELIFFAENVCNTIKNRNFADKLHGGLFCRCLFDYQQQMHEKQPLLRLLLKLF